MGQRLKGRIAVITGSSRGIGETIARAFASEGAKVVIIYHSQRLKAETIGQGIRAELVLQVDVKERESVRKMFQTVGARYGRIDILVNNAGINRPADFDRQTDQEWDEVIAVDLKGPFICCQEVLPYISNGGRIVNVGSVSGQLGGPRTPSYAAAKAGLIALTQCLARFVADKGITVNCLSPGIVESELTARTLPTELRQKRLANILLGHFGSHDDVAATAVFLASRGASFITAQTINVNGGEWW